MYYESAIRHAYRLYICTPNPAVNCIDYMEPLQRVSAHSFYKYVCKIYIETNAWGKRGNKCLRFECYRNQ